MTQIRKNFLIIFIAVLAALLMTGIALTTKILPASAAGSNSVYLTPSPVSVKANASFTVALRVNPSSPVDGLQAVVSYDSSKLQYVSGALDSSAFSLALQPLTATSGKLALSVGSLSSDVTVDSPVATFTFKALTGSGTSSISMTTGTSATSTNTTYSGAYLNPSVGNATVNFASDAVAVCPVGTTGTPPNCITPPVATCPTGQTGTPPNCVTPPKNCAAGQTGTPPNCVTPAPATCPTGTTGTPPNCVTPTQTTPVTGTPVTKDPTTTNGTTSSGATATAPSSSAPATQTPTAVENQKSSPAAPTVSVDNVRAYFTKAVLQITTDTQTRAYIEYGLSATALTSKTPTTEYDRVHQLVLDTGSLKPGTTYYYAAVAIDSDGNQTQTGVQKITTRGMYIRILVTDKYGHPLRKHKVTLHSTPINVTTDDKGYATFADIEPGTHQLIYDAGLKTYTESVSVASIVNTVADGETTTTQTATIRYAFNQNDTIIYILAAICLLLIAAIVYGFFYIRKIRRSGTSGPTVLTGSTDSKLSNGLSRFSTMITSVVHKVIKPKAKEDTYTPFVPPAPGTQPTPVAPTPSTTPASPAAPTPVSTVTPASSTIPTPANPAAPEVHKTPPISDEDLKNMYFNQSFNRDDPADTSPTSQDSGKK